MAGIAFGFTRSVKKQRQIIQEIPKEMEKINLQALEYGFHRLVAEKYIGLTDFGKGLYVPYLTKEGRKIAENCSLDNLGIKKPKIWDEKWRLVFFDIPEKYKLKRDAFRFHLNRLEFKKIQHSVFCHPFPCAQEIIKIATHYQLLPHVRFAVTEELNDDQLLRQHFKLN